MAAWDNIPFVEEQTTPQPAAWASVPFAEEPTPETKPTLGKRLDEEIERQKARSLRAFGLAARAGLTGITALPHLAGDIANRALNLIPGVNLGLPSERFQETMTGYGIPAPETGVERFAHTTGSAVTGAGLQTGIANALAQTAASPVTRNVMNWLAANPRFQLESAFTGSAAQQAAAEAGGGPAWQAAAGITGAMLPAGPRMAINAVRPSVATPDDVARLANVEALARENVSLTPGQIAGGSLQRAEDAAVSLPYTGDIVKRAQRQGLLTYDRAEINRALAPIGEQLPAPLQAGRGAVDYTHRRLSKAYDTQLARMYGQFDQTLQNDLNTLRTMGTAGLSPEASQQLNRILDREVANRFTPGGRVSGETIKQIQSELGNLSRRMRGSENYDTRQVGNALVEANDSIRRMLDRINPNGAAALARIDEGWAHLVRVEGAAAAAGAKEGVFTPYQLGSSVRRFDPSIRHSAYARGQALDQDLSDAGHAILSKTVPDSGTPYRSFLQHILTEPGKTTAGIFKSLPFAAAYSPRGLRTAQELLLGPRQNVLGGIPAITNVLAGIDQGGQ